MAQLITLLILTVAFAVIVSAHPRHRVPTGQAGVQHKKHGSHNHRHQATQQQQEEEDNRMAMEEAQKVLDSLDDLSSAVKRVSLATENGINVRTNEIADDNTSRPPFLMNVLKNVFKNLHRVSSTYQDDAPRFSTNFNNSIYECTKNEQESEAHAFSSMYLPKEVMIFADEANERSILMETHGLVTDDELSIYSVIRGKLMDMDMLIPSLNLLEDPLINLPNQVKPDGLMDGRQETGSVTTSQRPPLIVTVGEAVGDYMFRTVHALLSRMIHNMEDGHAVSALLRCEMDSIECLVDQRYDATGLRMCSSTLCKCMDAHLPDIGTVLKPTMSPQ